MHLIEMLPTIPLQLAFHSVMPGLTGFMHQKCMLPNLRLISWISLMCTPPLQSDQRVLDVLCDEIMKNACMVQLRRMKEVEPTWMMTVANVSTIGTKAVKDGAGNGPMSSPHVSCTPDQCSWTKSPSPCHCSQGSRCSSSSSSFSSGSGSAHKVLAAQVHHSQALVMSLTLAPMH